MINIQTTYGVKTQVAVNLESILERYPENTVKSAKKLLGKFLEYTAAIDKKSKFYEQILFILRNEFLQKVRQKNFDQIVETHTLNCIIYLYRQRLRKHKNDNQRAKRAS